MGDSMRVHVFIDTDGEATRSPAFSKPEVTLGRRPSNDVVLADASASGSHAKVFVTGSALTIVDLESTNGTFVNGRRLQGPHVLDADDVVEIGDTRLRFSLSGVEASMVQSVPQAPGASSGADPDWPAPPPMMDALDGAGPASGSPEVPAATAVDAASRIAVFPRLNSARGGRERAPPPPPPRPASRPAAVATKTTAAAFEFADAEPAVLLNRVFEAVWRRVSGAIVAAEAGARAQTDTVLEAALNAASAVRDLGDTSVLRTRMLAEMLDDRPIEQLLEGQPDEVTLISSDRARINRGGHVSEGPGPFSCRYAVIAWVRRVTGVTLSSTSPVARGVFGAYSVRAVYESSGGIVALRKRVPSGAASIDALVRAGVASPGMLSFLSAAVASRMSVLVCAGPGARTAWLMAGLLAGGAPHELQVALLSPGSDVAAFPSNAVVMTRTGRAGQSLEAALSLGPDRLAVESLEWSEAGAVAGLVSRSFSQVLGVRAPNAGAGLQQLRSMLSETADPAYSGNLTMRSVSLVVSLQHFSDGIDRITQLSEPVIDDAGRLVVQDIFTLVPGSRTWQFTGARPRSFEDIVQRGFPLDASIFA